MHADFWELISRKSFFFFQSFFFFFLITSLALLGPHCCEDFSLAVAGGGYSLVVAHGFSLQGLLSLQSMGPRAHRFR